MSDDFDFSVFGLPFPGLPPGIIEALTKVVVSGSKVERTMYEEHINNGFTEEQALGLVLSLQEHVVKAVAYVAQEIMINMQGSGE